MQLIVRRLEAVGDGLWRKAVELTRARLAADGLLAPERKRALPRHPRRIAIVTSEHGAALHDIVAVVRRRAPWVDLVLVPTAVQGDLAPEQIVEALDRVARWRACDLVIIGRGGGASEDLRAFNDERVARAVAACPIPIISAVGHEIDITLSDLVADLRAPTPSAAAEAAVRSGVEIAAELASLAGRLRGAVQLQVAEARDRAQHAANDLARVTERVAERKRAAVRTLSGRLHALSPLATLARGYAVARDDEGRVLSSVTRFTADMPFDLLLRDGRVHARAEGLMPDPTLPEGER
jgi:exodeoxyribonuclease VII large subunit